MANQTINIPASGVSRIGSSLVRIQLSGSNAVAINRNLRNGDAARYFGRIQFATTGTSVALRVGSSAGSATSSSRQDLSDAFETNGWIVIRQSGRQLALSIGGLDANEPYSFRLSGTALTQTRAFFTAIQTDTAVEIELWDTRPTGLTTNIEPVFNASGVGVFAAEIETDSIKINPIFEGVGSSGFDVEIEEQGFKDKIRPKIAASGVGNFIADLEPGKRTLISQTFTLRSRGNLISSGRYFLRFFEDPEVQFEDDFGERFTPRLRQLQFNTFNTSFEIYIRTTYGSFGRNFLLNGMISVSQNGRKIDYNLSDFEENTNQEYNFIIRAPSELYTEKANELADFYTNTNQREDYEITFSFVKQINTYTLRPSFGAASATADFNGKIAISNPALLIPFTAGNASGSANFFTKLDFALTFVAVFVQTIPARNIGTSSFTFPRPYVRVRTNTSKDGSAFISIATSETNQPRIEPTFTNDGTVIYLNFISISVERNSTSGVYDSVRLSLDLRFSSRFGARARNLNPAFINNGSIVFIGGRGSRTLMLADIDIDSPSISSSSYDVQIQSPELVDKFYEIINNSLINRESGALEFRLPQLGTYVTKRFTPDFNATATASFTLKIEARIKGLRPTFDSVGTSRFTPQIKTITPTGITTPIQLSFSQSTATATTDMKPIFGFGANSTFTFTAAEFKNAYYQTVDPRGGRARYWEGFLRILTTTDNERSFITTLTEGDTPRKLGFIEIATRRNSRATSWSEFENAIRRVNLRISNVARTQQADFIEDFMELGTITFTQAENSFTFNFNDFSLVPTVTSRDDWIDTSGPYSNSIPGSPRDIPPYFTTLNNFIEDVSPNAPITVNFSYFISGNNINPAFPATGTARFAVRFTVQSIRPTFPTATATANFVSLLNLKGRIEFLPTFHATGSSNFTPEIRQTKKPFVPVFNGTATATFNAVLDNADLFIISPKYPNARGAASFAVLIRGEVLEIVGDKTETPTDTGFIFPSSIASATWANSIPPNTVFTIDTTMVGWAVDIAGIGLNRRPFRLWSGEGQLTLEGVTYEGTTFDGGALATIGPVEQVMGDPNSRANVSISVPNAAIRSMLNIDIGPVWVEVFNIYSIDGGKTWTKLQTGIAGRLSRPNFDVEASIYTVEIETWSGDADRGVPKIWSDESQKAEYPNDRGMEFMREYESGVEIKWPP